jgi:hypothetical protein
LEIGLLGEETRDCRQLFVDAATPRRIRDVEQRAGVP